MSTDPGVADLVERRSHSFVMASTVCLELFLGCLRAACWKIIFCTGERIGRRTTCVDSELGPRCGQVTLLSFPRYPKAPRWFSVDDFSGGVSRRVCVCRLAAWVCLVRVLFRGGVASCPL